jgi:hypothetical protein
MVVVTCGACGANSSMRSVDGAVKVTHGADFQAKCKFFPDKQALDFIASATECPQMDATARKAAWRIRRTAAAKRTEESQANIGVARDRLQPLDSDPNG